MLRVNICFLLISVCYAANAARRSCSDCTVFPECAGAVALFQKNRDPASEARLKNGLCGFEGTLPKVCCSDYSTATTETKTVPEGVENHPNLSLLPEVCGKVDGDKIFGGRTAGLYEYPWMVLISFRTRLGLQFQCGGSLINERYVLTAAHCISGADIAGVRLGENDVDSSQDCQGEAPNLSCAPNVQDIRVVKTIPHENYKGKPNVRNDVGLLRLKKAVDLTAQKNIAPICLPVTRELLTRDVGGLNATVAGWGYTETGYASSKLLAVTVPIHKQEACRQLYNKGGQVGVDETLNKFCAGQNGKDSCGGDSGGPLMLKGPYKSAGHRFVQHGIVSYGPKLCGSDYPGVYTDVTKYMKWILDNMEA